MNEFLASQLTPFDVDPDTLSPPPNPSIRTGQFPSANLGWVGRDWAAYSLQEVRSKHPSVIMDLPLNDLVDDGPVEAVRLWNAVRTVLGEDTPNYPQEVGSCVGFGAKNVEEYLEAQEIIAGDREEFHLVYEPFNYGCSRKMGGFRLRGDGSTGAWMAAAAVKCGVLRADFPDVPPYSGSVDRLWGRSPGPPQEFLDEGDDHLIKKAAPINSLDEAIAAIKNGYPMTIASNQGFTMEAARDGFHQAYGSWSHQMFLAAYIPDPVPHWAVGNSWGDVHGTIKDFITDEVWPVGFLRVHNHVVQNMIRSGECFAFSQFDGFPRKRPDFRPWNR